MNEFLMRRFGGKESIGHPERSEGSALQLARKADSSPDGSERHDASPRIKKSSEKSCGTSVSAIGYEYLSRHSVPARPEISRTRNRGGDPLSSGTRNGRIAGSH